MEEVLSKGSDTMGKGPFSFINPESVPTTLPFPRQHASTSSNTDAASAEAWDISDSSTDDVLAAFANVSRRINDLAKELKCLGYFDDDDDDRPRAA